MNLDSVVKTATARNLFGKSTAHLGRHPTEKDSKTLVDSPTLDEKDREGTFVSRRAGKGEETRVQQTQWPD